MKIEIGESLCVSWLKHVKGCQIVQSNWKIASLDVLDDENILKKIFSFYQNKYKDTIGHNELFKNNDYLQLLKQGEVDAIGIDLSGEKNRIVALDIAFHENGLNYGSTKETSAIILKKLIRTAMSLIGYCKCDDGDIYFIAPLISKPTLKILLPLIDDLNNSFNIQTNKSYKFNLICNEEFEDRILNRILNVAENVSDTSELFMRSIQLIKLSKPNTFATTTNSSFTDLKIGKLIQTSLVKLISDSKLSKAEVDNLCNPDYCNKNLGLNSNLLKKLNGNILEERLDSKGHPRYYVEPIEIRSEKFLLLNNLFENNRELYLKWLKKFD